MHQAVIAILAGLGLAAYGAHPAAAQSRPSVPQGQVSAAQTEYSAQARPRLRRAQTRIVVTPYSRLYRECVDWYALEYRPSGTVLTPQMRCRWAVR